MHGIGYNERAWAIDLIAELRGMIAERRRRINGVGGEHTIRAGEERRFPDVVLSDDTLGLSLLQGWELKMPDTPVTDGDLIASAERKARLLGLDSFLVSNAESAVLHLLVTDTDEFEPMRTWEILKAGVTREDVRLKRQDWRDAFEIVLDDLNDLFELGRIRGRSLTGSIADASLVAEALAAPEMVGTELRDRANDDATFRAQVVLWWHTVGKQYPEFREPWVPLAKLLLLSWVSRFLFGHALSRWCDSANDLTQLDLESTAAEATDVCEQVSQSCDFRTILGPTLGSCFLSGSSWDYLLQLNSLLFDIGVGSLGDDVLRELLEALISQARRRAAGQFVTPVPLARILAGLVLREADATLIDPCCGTGTIARAVADVKVQRGVGNRDVMRQVWASDLFDIQVQMSTLAMTDPRAFGEPTRVFQADVRALQVGVPITLVCPDTGESFEEPLPKFGGVASNLPFVQFEDLREMNSGIGEINEFITRMAGSEYTLPGNSDLYAYLPFYFWRFMGVGARACVIMSNSWLATGFGAKFRESLQRFFDIESVAVSGAGRWFSETDVVATMTTLVRKEMVGPTAGENVTHFAVVQAEIAQSTIPACDQISSSVILGESNDLLTTNTITYTEIRQYESLGLQWAAFFADTSWLREIARHLVPVSDSFEVARGERRGWNAMFYPAEGHGIEEEYLQPVLRSPRTVDGLIAEPDAIGFFCSRSLEELRERGDRGALAWISRFARATNKKGVPLPESCARAGHHWYEMRSDAQADLIGPVNPGRRLFFPRMRESGFVDQRLIRLRLRSTADVDLLHAILNTSLTMYYLEAIGFGRGLGALDLNPTKIKNDLRILNPASIGSDNRQRILASFEPLLARDVLPVHDEILQVDRIGLDATILSAFGLEGLAQQIRDSLMELYSIRHAAVA